MKTKVWGAVIVNGVEFENNEMLELPRQIMPMQYGVNWVYDGDQGIDESNIFVETDEGDFCFEGEHGLPEFLVWLAKQH